MRIARLCCIIKAATGNWIILAAFEAAPGRGRRNDRRAIGGFLLVPGRYPFLTIAAGQAFGGLAAAAVVRFGGDPAAYGGIVGLCLIWGGIAGVTSGLMNLARGWIAIQALLPMAAWLAAQLEVPGWVFAAAAVLTLLIFWNAARERVPLFLSNRTTWRALETLLSEDKPCRYVDLGSGLGGGLFYLAEQRPDCTFTGVETAPLVYAYARLRLMINPRPNLDLEYRSLWNVDLGEFDVVYCFLSPAPMARLYEKARAEMKPGSKLISNSFNIPDHEPDEILELGDGRKTQLLIWNFR